MLSEVINKIHSKILILITLIQLTDSYKVNNQCVRV